MEVLLQKVKEKEAIYMSKNSHIIQAVSMMVKSLGMDILHTSSNCIIGQVFYFTIFQKECISYIYWNVYIFTIKLK